jgi:hypothetical protein
VCTDREGQVWRDNLRQRVGDNNKSTQLSASLSFGLRSMPTSAGLHSKWFIRQFRCRSIWQAQMQLKVGRELLATPRPARSRVTEQTRPAKGSSGSENRLTKVAAQSTEKNVTVAPRKDCRNNTIKLIKRSTSPIKAVYLPTVVISYLWWNYSCDYITHLRVNSKRDSLAPYFQRIRR